MRCTKCGFTSFDYLSECRKCGTSLAAAREGLGFTALKPAIPSLLGSLLSDFEPAAKQTNAAVESQISTSFDFNEGLGDGLNEIQPETEPEEAASAIPDPEEGEEDFSLLDLSDDELELLIDKDPNQSEEAKPIWLGEDREESAGKTSEPPSLAEPVSAAETSGPAPEKDVEPDLSFAPFGVEDTSENSLFKSEGKTREEADELTLDFADDPFMELDQTPKASPAEFEAPAKKKEKSPDKTGDDDFVIELSENDLDALLEELGGSRKEESDKETEKK